MINTIYSTTRSEVITAVSFQLIANPIRKLDITLTSPCRIAPVQTPIPVSIVCIPL